METHLLRIQQSFVDDHLHLLVHVVYLGEQRQMALLHSQNRLQQLVVSEAERSALVLQLLHRTTRPPLRSSASSCPRSCRTPPPPSTVQNPPRRSASSPTLHPAPLSHLQEQVLRRKSCRLVHVPHHVLHRLRRLVMVRPLPLTASLSLRGRFPPRSARRRSSSRTRSQPPPPRPSAVCAPPPSSPTSHPHPIHTFAFFSRCR